MLILSRITLDIWYITTGTWNIKTSLPLELCSITSLLAAIMLLTKSRFLTEVLYFTGISGAMQAILTPNLDFGFPQYRFLQFFLDHTLLIAAPLIMIFLYKITINFSSVIKAFLFINVIAAFVFMMDTILKANYMFLTGKPATVSMLDFLGPYPFYIIILEAIAVIMFFILYLPFRVFKRGGRETSY